MRPRFDSGSRHHFKEMIITVTLNPSLDSFISVNDILIDDVNRVVRIQKEPGGKGINISKIIHEVGGETLATGLIGGHEGRQVEELLEKYDILTDFTQIEGATRTNIFVHNLKTNTQTRFDAAGPQVFPHELDRFMKRMVFLIESNPDMIIFAGTIPPGVAIFDYQTLIRAAHDSEIKTAIDADGEILKELIKEALYFIKPNVYEAERLLGKKIKKEEEIVKAVRQILDEGVQIAVISKGSEGIIGGNKEEIWEVKPPVVEATNSVGTGDAFIGGAILRLSLGNSLEESFKYGVACGTSAAMALHPGLCTWNDVEKYYDAVKAERIQ